MGRRNWEKMDTKEMTHRLIISPAVSSCPRMAREFQLPSLGDRKLCGEEESISRALYLLSYLPVKQKQKLPIFCELWQIHMAKYYLSA